MPMHQALTRFSDRLRTILPRHEQGGGFAAEGYARSTGKVGVCMATSGPGRDQLRHLPGRRQDGLGAASSPSPARSARPSSAPTPSRRRRSSRSAGPSPSTTTWCTRTEDIPRVIKEAFHIASTGRPGPVIIDVPKDVQNKQIVPDYDPPMNLPGYRPDRAATARAAARRSSTLIRQSKKPIIYAGGGIIASGAAAVPAGRSPSRPASPWP